MKTNLKIIFSILILISIAGCSKRNPFVSSSCKYDFSENQENVTLSIRKAQQKDKTRISQKSILEKYLPLEIKIENLSTSDFILKSDQIDQKIITPTEIENNKSTVLNLYKFISNSSFIMIWLLICIITIFAYLFFYHKIILLLIPLSFFGLNTTNNEIIHFFQKKNAQKHASSLVIKADTEIKIPSNSVVQKAIFIEKESFKPKFEIKIEEANNHKHEIVFKIDLEKETS